MEAQRMEAKPMGAKRMEAKRMEVKTPVLTVKREPCAAHGGDVSKTSRSTRR